MAAQHFSSVSNRHSCYWKSLSHLLLRFVLILSLGSSHHHGTSAALHPSSVLFYLINFAPSSHVHFFLDGQLCVSLIDHWVPRWKHYFWMCQWGCFQMRLAFDSVDPADSLPERGWASFSPLRVWTEQTVEEEGTCPLFPALVPELGYFIASSPALGLESTPWFSWVSGSSMADWGMS